VELFEQPQHPYTRGLMASIPKLTEPGAPAPRLAEIPGIVPALNALPRGCTFAERCPYVQDRCREAYPPLE